MATAEKCQPQKVSNIGFTIVTILRISTFNVYLINMFISCVLRIALAHYLKSFKFTLMVTNMQMVESALLRADISTIWWRWS